MRNLSLLFTFLLLKKVVAKIIFYILLRTWCSGCRFSRKTNFVHKQNLFYRQNFMHFFGEPSDLVSVELLRIIFFGTHFMNS